MDKNFTFDFRFYRPYTGRYKAEGIYTFKTADEKSICYPLII